jgi:hypothetical protein
MTRSRFILFDLFYLALSRLISFDLVLSRFISFDLVLSRHFKASLFLLSQSLKMALSKPKHVVLFS